MGRSAKEYRTFLITYLKPQWPMALLMAVLLLVSIALQLLNPQILRYFIDSATSGGNLTNLLLAGALFVGVALANQATSVLATYASQKVAWTATNQLRTDMLAHMLTLDMSFHKARTPGELIERIDGDVTTLTSFFSQLVVQLLGNALLILGVLILLFYEDWRVGIVLSLFAFLALFLLIWLRGRTVQYYVADRQKSAEFIGFLGEQLVGTEDIRANGATDYVMQRFYQLLRRWFPINRKASISGYSMWTAMLLVFVVGDVLALSLGAYLWSIHSITLGGAYLIFYYTTLLGQPIEQMRTQFQELQKAGAGVERTLELLETRSAIVDGPGAALPSGALAVDFRHVSFGYNAADLVLDDINMHVQPGKVLGVLGRTGSGKTTLARLLLRLYDPQQGEVCVGGVPVSQPQVRELRRHIGMVTQDVQLFQATVRDNLTFFNRSIADARIVAALDDLGLSPWLRSLPQGLDTELGADGEGLSAGEAQLLAFTRVFLANPGLVILDEASSRLDPATEQRLERAISKLLTGRTGIVIAHRLATVQRVDEVLVLEDGRVLEHGPRAALAADPTSRFYRLLQTGLETTLLPDDLQDEKMPVKEVEA